MFLDTTQTKPAKLPTAAAITTLIILLAVVGASAPAAAQTTVTVGNSTADETDEEDDRGEALLYQFENGGEVVSIDFEAGTAYITLRATDGPTRFWIAESVEESGGFSFQNFRVLPGGTRTLEIPASGNAVTITSGNDGYYHEGAGRVTIVTGTPTGELGDIDLTVD